MLILKDYLIILYVQIHSERDRLGALEPRPNTTLDVQHVTDLLGHSRRMQSSDWAYRYNRGPDIDTDSASLLHTLLRELAASKNTDKITQELQRKTSSPEDAKQTTKSQGCNDKSETQCSIEALTVKSTCELLNANIYTLHEMMVGMQQLLLITLVFVIGLGLAHILNACGTLAWTAVLQKK